MYHLFLHGVSWEQTKSSSESASISRYGVLKPPLNYLVPLLPQCKMTVVIFKFMFFVFFGYFSSHHNFFCLGQTFAICWFRFSRCAMYGGHIFHQERHITCPLSVAHVICTSTVIDPVLTYTTHLPKWLIMSGGARSCLRWHFLL